MALLYVWTSLGSAIPRRILLHPPPRERAMTPTPLEPDPTPHPTKRVNPRRANGTKRNRVRRQVLRTEDNCWICGAPVDKTLPPYLPGSPEVDEVIPVSMGGDPFDRGNCRLSHRACNNRRGNGTRPTTTALTTTRAWRI